jgi:hypothetical protein
MSGWKWYAALALFVALILSIYSVMFWMALARP